MFKLNLRDIVKCIFFPALLLPIHEVQETNDLSGIFLLRSCYIKDAILPCWSAGAPHGRPVLHLQCRRGSAVLHPCSGTEPLKLHRGVKSANAHPSLYWLPAPGPVGSPHRGGVGISEQTLIGGGARGSGPGIWQ